jgi:hypothetical protein
MKIRATLRALALSMAMAFSTCTVQPASAITITDQTPWVPYTATAGQTVFPYDWPIFNQAHLRVYQNNVLQTLTTHYTVSGVGAEAGGNVTLLTGATVSDAIVIYRVSPLESVSNYSTGGAFTRELGQACSSCCRRPTQTSCWAGQAACWPTSTQGR